MWHIKQNKWIVYKQQLTYNKASNNWIEAPNEIKLQLSAVMRADKKVTSNEGLSCLPGILEEDMEELLLLQ